jgi:dTDP-4-amino-4,6-dideoxygalactose transaminase
LLPQGVDRTAFIDAMRAAGVQTSIHYPPIHKFSYYRQRYGDIALPITEAAAAREVTLPLYPTMSSQAVDIVVSSVQQALEAAACGGQQETV